MLWCEFLNLSVLLKSHHGFLSLVSLKCLEGSECHGGAVGASLPHHHPSPPLVFFFKHSQESYAGLAFGVCVRCDWTLVKRTGQEVDGGWGGRSEERRP